MEELDKITFKVWNKLDRVKVEASLRKCKVQNFLDDVVELCIKHKVSFSTESDSIPTLIQFEGWDEFISLEADEEGASLYWPRIQTDIVVRRKNEQRKSKEDC